jgi:murein L,D-transpeptidase YcbB/YkuD
MSFDNVFRPITRQLLLVLALTSLGFAQTPSPIERLVSDARLVSMRWPDFHDYRTSLQRFYKPVNYAPAWLQGDSPSPQALAMIKVFRNAWKKGLDPEDFDASRWNRRLQALKTSAASPADFDTALTVCTMRYVSDLRIGRIDPQHFKFGLSVERKKSQPRMTGSKPVILRRKVASQTALCEVLA